MLKTLAKGYAYSHHPRLTFAALHPEEAIQLKHMEYDLRHAYAPRLVGVVAVAVALPIGIWIGRLWAEARAEKRGARTPKRSATRRHAGTHATERVQRPALADAGRLPVAALESTAPGEARR